MARIFLALSVVLSTAAAVVVLYDGPTALAFGLMIAGGLAAAETV